MKRLAVFFDGTWNVPANDTNVSRLSTLVAPVDRAATEQLTTYVRGIGTDWYDRFRGAFGKAINKRVREAYLWLADHYDPGDEIFVFGFSRGAFEARSLVGFLGHCGLARATKPDVVKQLFERYRDGRSTPNRSDLETKFVRSLRKDDLAFLRRTVAARVTFLGVWDTVRYSDVPCGRIRGLSRSENLFHNIMGTGVCKQIRQAIAIDEHREPYRAEPFETLVEDSTSQDIEQRWFAGDHCDVGGGHTDSVVARIPLRWMQIEAEKAGLLFTEAVTLFGNEHIQPLHDTYSSFLKGVFHLAQPRYYRPMPASTAVEHSKARQTIDRTVFERWRHDANYRPINLIEWAGKIGCDPDVQFGDFAFCAPLQPRLQHARHDVNASPLVLLIHGTGIKDELQAKPQWWRSNSDFAVELSKRLPIEFAVIGGNDGRSGFNWHPGQNSELARIAAGARLLHRLADLESRKRIYHLVGHSHGGSVIWHALREAAARREYLRHLGSWTTVGTPFLEFRPSPSGPWQAASASATILIVVILAAGSGLRFDDFRTVWYGLAGNGFYLALASCAVAFSLLLVSFASLAHWTIQTFLRRWRRRRDESAAEAFGSRWLGIWHTDDEAIAGLSASMAAPPELVPRIAGASSSGIRRLLSAPYDRFVAGGGDGFAWRAFMRRLQGSDIAAIDLIGAAPAPAALRPGWAALAQPVEERIRSRVDLGLPDALRFARARLEAIRVTGVGRKLLEVLPPDLWSSVIHNAYFEDDSIAEMVADHVKVGLQPNAAVSPRVAPPAFRANSWFALRSALAMLVVVVASISIGIVIAPLTHEFQIDAISRRIKSYESLAIENSSEVGRVLTRLDILGRLGDPGDAIAMIVDPSTASYAAQRLAYSYGYAGESARLQRLLDTSDQVARGTGMDGSIEKAAVLLQALVGAADAKLPTDGIVEEMTGEFRQLPDFGTKDLFDSAIFSLEEIGFDQAALTLLRENRDGKSWCEEKAAHILTEGSQLKRKEGQPILDLCKAAQPSADLDQGPSLDSGGDTSPERLKPVVVTKVSPVPELMGLVRTNQVAIAKDKIADILAKDQGFGGASLQERIDLAKAFEDVRDEAGSDMILRLMYGSLTIGQERFRAAAALTEQLIKNRLDRGAQKVATKLGSVELTNDFVQGATIDGLETSASIFYTLHDVKSSKESLNRALDQLRKSSGEPDFVDYAINLSVFSRGIDYAMAHSFLDVGLAVTSKNPKPHSRSRLYAKLAWYFANLGDYRSARDSAERSGDLADEDGESGRVYQGLLGGYKAILDVEIRNRSNERARALGYFAAGPRYLAMNYTESKIPDGG